MRKLILTGPQQAALQRLLVRDYTDGTLADLLHECDQDYDEIRLAKGNRRENAAEVVKTAQRQNWLVTLLVEASRNNPDVKEFYDTVTRARAAADPDPRARGDHVVFAVACTDRGRETADEFAAHLRRTGTPAQAWRGDGYKLRASEVLVFIATPDASTPDSACRAEVEEALAMGLDVVALAPGSRSAPADWMRALDTVGGFDALTDRLRLAGLPERRLQKLLDRRERIRRNRHGADAAEIARIDNELDDLDALIDELNLRGTRRPGGVPAGVRPSTAPAPADEPVCHGEPPASPPGEFQDRKPYRDEIVELLTRTGVRMVALIGPAGIGKTGLIAELLAGLRAKVLPWRLRGFVYLPVFGFEPVNAATVVLALLPMVRDEDACRRLETARRQGIGWRDLLDRVLDELAGFPVLVVIDNADELFETVDGRTRFADEELREVVDMIRERDDRDVRVLLVSQADAVPAGSEPVRLGHGLDRDDARAFLLALDGDGRLGLSGVPQSRITYLCSLLGGQPRALELLFAWLSGGSDRSIADLIGRLERDPVENLTEFLLNRTFDGLDREDRRILQILAVFGRPVPLAAIKELLRPYVRDAATDLRTARLTRLRLIRRDAGDRYYVPPRQDRDALLRTLDPGRGVPLGQVRLAHLAAEYFARRPNTPEKITELGDLADHLAEIDLRIRAGEHGTALDLIADLNDRYLLRWNYADVAVRALAQFPAEMSVRRRRWLESQLAWAYSKQRRPDLAAAHARAALDRGPRADHRAGLMATLGDAAFDAGRYDEAAEWFRSVLAATSRWRPGAWASRASAYIGLGTVRARAGDFDGALAMQAKAAGLLPRRSSTEKRQLLVAIAGNEGRLHRLIGDYAVARDRLDEGIRIGRDAALGLELAECYLYRADLALAAGDTPAAVDDAREAARIGSRTGDRQMQRDARAMLALAGLARRDLKDAADAVRRDRTATGRTLWGMIAYRDGDRSAAAEAFEQALALLPDRAEFEILDHRALILAGLALSRPDESLVDAAAAAYRAARDITGARGVVQRINSMIDSLDSDSGFAHRIGHLALGKKPRGPEPGGR
ncbi:AAA family ATPase [Actinoplanes sp. CA-030573]|uniref:AAA family ATPase n=1 Tax=Actinoplanes sp. CA-030573 TaxID=3239898 RepID=UPI003D94DAB9